MLMNNLIVNWENIFAQSSNFKNQKPFKFGFIEGALNKEFYEKLYKTIPKIDSAWNNVQSAGKSQIVRYWRNTAANDIVNNEYDPKFSPEWNEFKKYVSSEEFIKNFRNFSGIPVNKLKQFHFIACKKGGFQLPHIHNVGPSTIVFMMYFSKNWKKGDPGGTYMANDEDDSKILFEPCNLDNTLALFHDGPKAMHGMRLITEDVERMALQITLEEYTEDKGWSGSNPEEVKQHIESEKIEL
jgi:hypothetical protein